MTEHQYDSIFYRKDRSICVVHCYCDTDAYDGEVILKYNANEDEVLSEIECIDVAVIPGYRTGFRERIKRIWKALTGQPYVFESTTLTRNMALDLSDWLREQASRRIV